MAHEQTTLTIILPEELKDALLAFSGKAGGSTGKCVREAIAKHIGFDLVGYEQMARKGRRDGRGRPRIYESPEAQRSAAYQRAKADRALATALMAEHDREDAARQRAALQASVNARERRQQANEVSK